MREELADWVWEKPNFRRGKVSEGDYVSCEKVPGGREEHHAQKMTTIMVVAKRACGPANNTEEKQEGQNHGKTVESGGQKQTYF